MKIGQLILLLFVHVAVYAQKDTILVKRCIDFHQKLIANDKSLINYLDDNLSYGHSNGWLESRQDMLSNLNSGKIKYNGIEEDSITSVADKELGWVRFVADMNVEMNGKPVTFRLKVLEVWRQKDGSWKLYARQAVRQ